MKKYKGYLIDLDGTMYKGTEPILEAVHFVQQLKEKGIPYLFVTNNSSRTPKQVAEKLCLFNIPATAEQVITTSMAAANYIYEIKKDASVYIIGEDGLIEAVQANNLFAVQWHPELMKDVEEQFQMFIDFVDMCK